VVRTSCQQRDRGGRTPIFDFVNYLPDDLSMPAPDRGERRLTIAVIGLGGIGGGAAGSLAAAGRHDVVACVRQNISRFTLDRESGMVEPQLAVLTEPERAQPVDWVLLCTKAHQTKASAPWLQRLCTRTTHVAVMQNGIDHVERVKPLVGDATVVPVLVYYNGERLAPDRVRIRHAGPKDVVVADNEAGRAFAQLLDGTELHALLSNEFATLAWRKLLINAVANPITALTLQRQAVLRRPDVEALCGGVLEEAVAAARADGVPLAADEVARTLVTLRTFSPAFGTSMYFDRLAGRTLEAEALTGAIVATAERHGVAAPLNRALLALLRAINDAAGNQPAG
jgi:2-dehydropantoate 2-reductase